MTTWTNNELNKIGTAEELEIAPRRRDGTPRKPVTIWVVRVNDDLYVRSPKHCFSFTYLDDADPGGLGHYVWAGPGLGRGDVLYRPRLQHG